MPGPVLGLWVHRLVCVRARARDPRPVGEPRVTGVCVPGGCVAPVGGFRGGIEEQQGGKPCLPSDRFESQLCQSRANLCRSLGRPVRRDSQAPRGQCQGRRRQFTRRQLVRRKLLLDKLLSFYLFSLFYFP